MRIEWGSPATDWDTKLYEDTNGNGKSDVGVDKEIATSAQGTNNVEEVSVAGEAAMTPGKKYVFRVVNYAAVEPYDLTVTFGRHLPFVAAQTERFSLSCELGGKTTKLGTVFVDRGQVAQLDLGACARGAAAAAGKCAIGKGFKSVRVRPRGRGARFAFKRRAGVTGKVKVVVAKQSRGRSLIKPKVVARFKKRTKSFTWKRAKGGNGFFVARFRVKTASGVDVRRVALRRSKGRFKVRKAYLKPKRCKGLLRQFTLRRPVFGGRASKPLRVAFRLGSKAKVKVAVLRGKRVVRRVKQRTVKGKKLTRLSVRSARLARGNYRVRITVKKGKKRVRATLRSRRI